MTPNYAYPVRSYNDLVVGTSLTVSQFATANPQTHGLQDGPETPVGFPNLVTESVSQPAALTFEDATTHEIYSLSAQHYVGGHPPHR